MTKKQAPEFQWPGLVLGNLSDGIIVTGKRDRVVFMNAAAEALTGMTKETAFDLPLQDVFKLAQSNIKFPTLRSFRQNPLPRHLRRSVLLAKGGKKNLVEGTLSPVLDTKGRIVGAVLLCRDISEIVADEHATLDRLKIQAIGSLARSVSLDFSNWLSAISGHASSIADNLIPNTRAHEEALRILDVVERANGLTKRLLSAARAAHIKGDAKTEKLALEEILRDAIALAEGAFLKQRISFKIRSLDKTHHVMAESGPLLDCLIQIFLNAADSIAAGGTITLDVSETTESGKHFVVLRIRDTGRVPGKERLDRVLYPFFPAGKASSSDARLSLSVAQTAIHSWGGMIDIRSRPGRGTSLRLLFPRSDISSAKEPKAKSPSGIGGETILFADDDAKLVAAMKIALKEAGYRVLDATSGEDAIAIYNKQADQINLCIVDVVMPEKDGKRVFGEILRIDPTAAVIMSSGFSREYVRGYLDRGAWTFIQKPYDSTQLLTVVRRALDQKTARQKAAAV